MVKGIIIHETLTGKKAVEAYSYDNISKIDVESTEVEVKPMTARCSKDDTYDFETGALIALMKLCGVEKVKKACLETFFEVADNGVNEKSYGINPPNQKSKREKMWEDILNGKIRSVKVLKADIDDFLLLAENFGLVWGEGGERPTEWSKWKVWRKKDFIVFTIDERRLWWGVVRKKDTVDYLPHIRWDLFAKGRIVVGVRVESELNDFVKNLKEWFHNVTVQGPYFRYPYTFYIYNKDTNVVEAISKNHSKQFKTINNHKVYYWEDVR